MYVLFLLIVKLHSIKGNENKPKKVTKITKNNIKSIWKHVCPTYAIPGLRFCLRFWRGVLRFCLRFPIKCEQFLLSAAAASFVAYLLASTYLLLLVAAAGSSWLLKPFSAYVRLTFCLRFSYVKNCSCETLRKSMFGQQDRQTHVETKWFSKARCLTSKYNTTPASRAIRIGPYKPDQKQ